MRNHEPEKRVSANEPWPERYRALQIGGAFAIIRRAISTAVPALLAQLAEQLTLNQRVVGSSPTGGISVSTRQHPPRNVQTPSFPVFRAPSTQEHSIPSTRPEATDNVQKRPPKTPQHAPQDSDLAAVIEAWDHLPEAIRAGIVAMVKAASGK